MRGFPAGLDKHVVAEAIGELQCAIGHAEDLLADKRAELRWYEDGLRMRMFVPTEGKAPDA